MLELGWEWKLLGGRISKAKFASAKRSHPAEYQARYI